MELNALVIVYVQIVALSCRKHGIVLQEADIIDFLLGLELYNEVLVLPVKHSKVTFATSK